MRARRPGRSHLGANLCGRRIPSSLVPSDLQRFAENMHSWMQLIVEEKCSGKGKMEGSACGGGISTVETCFEPVSDGLLKLAGSGDFEPTGEEPRRLRPHTHTKQRSLGWPIDLPTHSPDGRAVDSF